MEDSTRGREKMTFCSYDNLMLNLDSQTSDDDRRRERIRNESIKDLIKNVVEPVKARNSTEQIEEGDKELDKLTKELLSLKGGKKK